MDTLTINQLRFNVTLGIYGWEQQIKQPLLVDISLGIDAAKIAATDELDSSLDYARLSQELQTWLDDTSFQLVETLSEKMADWVLEQTSCSSVKLTVTKPNAIPNAAGVSVTLERTL